MCPEQQTRSGNGRMRPSAGRLLASRGEGPRPVPRFAHRHTLLVRRLRN